MALTIIATPGANDANSYITENEFDAYCEAHVSGASAIAAAVEMKKAALIQATRQLDAYVVWKGWPSQPDTQVLAWPRTGLWLLDNTLADWPTGKAISSTVIPSGLKRACAEQARLLLVGDRAAELEQQTQGLKRLSVGGAVDLEFNAGGSAVARQVIAPSAWAFIQTWGAIRQPERGGVVPLARL